ncbi:hypothetical protein PCAU_2460 [Pseudomonas chlororaphis subsp. aurantiaca]|nr:hypothetical protein PCAU_2460 [Pseudomonas chlororaphis subsp. aurantiaca]
MQPRSATTWRYKPASARRPATLRTKPRTDGQRAAALAARGRLQRSPALLAKPRPGRIVRPAVRTQRAARGRRCATCALAMPAAMPITVVPTLITAMPAAPMAAQQTFEKTHVDHS